MTGETRALSELSAGVHATVDRFKGGREIVNRLLVLGLTIGADVKILQNYGSGPIIISVKDSRVALGRGEAKKVIVTVIGKM